MINKGVGLNAWLCFAFFGAWLSVSAQPGSGESIYTQKTDDPTAVYLTPEHFDVVADGIHDDAPALQAAIDAVYERSRQGVVFVPEGTYRLGKTIRLWSGIRLIGYGARKPVFKLGHETPGFQEGEHKYMVHFCQGPAGIRVEQPGTWQTDEFVDGTWVTFYSGIINIDFEIGEGNPAAIAVRYHVAQGCMLKNIHFNIGSGLGAVEDMGNLIESCTFSGGEWGINTKPSPPDWQCMVLDCDFEGQRQASVITDGARMLAIRCRFRHAPIGILVPDREKLYVKDSRFEDISRSAMVIRNFVPPDLQVNLENVQFADVPFSMKFSGRAQGWAKDELKTEYEAPAPVFAIKQFSHGLHIDVPSAKTFPAELTTKMKQAPLKALGEIPSKELPNLPPQSSWVNICELGATGDGETDCTAVFEEAIENYDAIYVPMGSYVLSRTLELKGKTQLIGLHPSKTLLVLKNNTDGFTDPEMKKPLLVASRGGADGISGIGFNLGDNPGVIGINWMGGPRSCLDDSLFTGSKEHDLFGVGQSCTLWITDGGGGIFKNFWINDQRSRIPLYVNDTESPGKVYQISVEHHEDLEVKIEKAANWSFYALQLEEDRGSEETLGIHIKDSSNIFFANLISHRTSGVWKPCHSAIRINNCRDIRICGNEMRGGVFPFEHAVFDEVTGQAVSYRVFAQLNINRTRPE